MARRYPSSGNYDTGRYSRGYIPVNSSSYIGGPGPGPGDRRQETVSYRDRWLGSRTQETAGDSYRHRSSSPDRQFRQTISSAGPGPTYRSRSWETSTSSNTRERLHGRESYNMSSGSSRNYLPSRSYGRSISFGKDSYLSPVTAPRKNESYTGGILKHTTSGNNDPPVSILTRGGSGDSVSGSRRQRHNTLTFGVSGEDLDRARTNIQKYTRRLSDDTRPQLHHSDPSPALSKKTTSRYSLPDVFDSLSGSNYYDSRLDRDNMVRDIMVDSKIIYRR